MIIEEEDSFVNNLYSSFKNGVYTQKLISPVTEQGAKTTLGHLLDLIAPEGGNRLSGVIHGILVGKEIS